MTNLQTTLRAHLRRAKKNKQITPEAVAAFAMLHMQTNNGEPIFPSDHHLLWLRLMCDPAIRQLLIVGTPESAKTTWALAYAGCHVAFFPDWPVIIAATSGEVAEQRCLSLRTIVESAEFKRTFPNVKPARRMPWTTTKWSMAEGGTPKPGRIHPTVSAYGTGGSIIGSRARLILADDILDYENTRTKHQRDVVDTWFHTSLMSRLIAKDGRVIVIGNAHHHDDTVARLRKNEGWVSCWIPLLSDGPEVIAHLTYPSDFLGEPIGEPVGIAG